MVIQEDAQTFENPLSATTNSPCLKKNLRRPQAVAWLNYLCQSWVTLNFSLADIEKGAQETSRLRFIYLSGP